MTHSLEDSTPDSHTCEPGPAQDLHLGIVDPIEAIRRNPPKSTDGGKTLFGLGAMSLNVKTGRPQQDPQTYQLWDATFQEVVDLYRKNRRVGEKHNQLCVTMGHPKPYGFSTEDDCAGVLVGFLDIDEQMDDDRWEKLKKYFSPYGAYLFTSASHDPLGVSGPPVYKAKIMFLFDTCLTYKQSAIVMGELRQEVADYAGIDLVAGPKAIDLCCERAMQPQLIPAHKSTAVMGQAKDFLAHGPAFPAKERARRAQERIETEEALELEHRIENRRRAKAALDRLGSNAHGAVLSHTSFMDDSGRVEWSLVAAANGINAEEMAIDEIAALGIKPGQHRSNDGLFRSAWICREWALSVERAECVLQQVYAGLYDSERLREKVLSCYKRPPSPSDGRKIAHLIGEREITLDDLYLPEQSTVTSLVQTPLYKNKLIGGVWTRDTDLAVEQGELAAPGDLQGAPDQLGHPDAVILPRGRQIVRHINQPQLDLVRTLADIPARLWMIRSPCGTGKNFTLRGLFEMLARSGKRAMGVVNRRSLAWSLHRSYPSLGCYLAEGVVDKDGGIDQSAVVCLDSILKVRSFVFENGEEVSRRITITLLDEVEQLAQHMVGGTISKAKKIAPVYQALARMLQNSDYIIAQDADLSPLAARFLRDLLGWVKPEDFDQAILINDWVDTDRSAITYECEGAVVQKLIEVGATDPVWYFSSTEMGATVAHLAYTRTYPGKKAILLTQPTSLTAEAKALLRETDPQKAAIAWRHFDAVFCSTTVGTGISVEQHFNVFANCQTFRDGLTAQANKQGIERVRPAFVVNKTVHLYIGGRIYHGECNSEVIQSNRRISTKENKAYFDKISGWKEYVERANEKDIKYIDPNDPAISALAADVEAQRNQWGNNFCDVEITHPITKVVSIKKCRMRAHLEQIGYTLRAGPSLAPDEKKALDKWMMMLRKEVRDQTVKACKAANPHTVKEAKAIYGEGGTPEAEAALTKAEILAFHGLQDKDLSEEKIARDNDGRYRALCISFAWVVCWQLGGKAPIVALDAENADSGVSVQLSNAALRTDLLVAMFAAFGIKDFLQDSKDGTPIVAKPTALAYLFKHRDTVFRVLGWHLTKDHEARPMTLLRSLLLRVGLKTISTRPRSTTGSRPPRGYQLDPQRTIEMMGDAMCYLDKITTAIPQPLAGDLSLEELPAVRADLGELLAAMLSD